jgi:hypothetical protein
MIGPKLTLNQCRKVLLVEVNCCAVDLGVPKIFVSVKLPP